MIRSNESPDLRRAVEEAKSKRGQSYNENIHFYRPYYNLMRKGLPRECAGCSVEPIPAFFVRNPEQSNPEHDSDPPEGLLGVTRYAAACPLPTSFAPHATLFLRREEPLFQHTTSDVSLISASFGVCLRTRLFSRARGPHMYGPINLVVSSGHSLGFIRYRYPTTLRRGLPTCLGAGPRSSARYLRGIFLT